MKTVYYVGFYTGTKYCGSDKSIFANPAASLKMDFIIEALKKLGYKVKLISITVGKKAGYHKLEHYVIDNQEEHYYIPYISINAFNKNIGSTRSAMFFLQRYLNDVLTKDDIVINYHSLGYGNMFRDLHQKIGFRWCPQVEEIYCLSRKDYQDKGYLKKEEAMFAGAGGYLFVNDMLPEKYAYGKPCAVSYGNYKSFLDTEPSVEGNIINLTYTGIINEDRGIFLILAAMRLLPENYHLNILGFGSPENMDRMHKEIDAINSSCHEKRINFYGTKSGKDYTEFLSHNQIGISLMDVSEDISFNAFPSKIMAYLGHNLAVVSSKSCSIVNSKIADLLYFCDNTPEDIARVIREIDIKKIGNNKRFLKKLEDDFLVQLKNVLEGV